MYKSPVLFAKMCKKLQNILIPTPHVPQSTHSPTLPPPSTTTTNIQPPPPPPPPPPPTVSKGKTSKRTPTKSVPAPAFGYMNELKNRKRN